MLRVAKWFATKLLNARSTLTTISKQHMWIVGRRLGNQVNWNVFNKTAIQNFTRFKTRDGLWECVSSAWSAAYRLTNKPFSTYIPDRKEMSHRGLGSENGEADPKVLLDTAELEVQERWHGSPRIRAPNPNVQVRIGRVPRNFVFFYCKQITINVGDS